MTTEEHHEELIEGIAEQLKPILENSDQAIYIYLDDIHKICNKKFASMLGYKSPQEWADIKESFTDSIVDKPSQEVLVTAYQKAMENLVGSSFKVTWNKKNGEKVKSDVILVPIVYEGHLFALHFIS